MVGVVPLTTNGGPIGSDAFGDAVRQATSQPLRGATLDTVQVNIGLRCNLACHHCHVESSPSRTEEMSWYTMECVLAAAVAAKAKLLDITGGAPEMHPRFRSFVVAARDRGLDVMVRTNLTILLEPGYETIPEFFRDRDVKLVASLPCYLEENVDKQRGRRVYQHSIDALRRLNEVGYGTSPDLELTLVYNPLGPSLPPAADALEGDYRRVLRDEFGIEFSRLITITNMPIGRFEHDLARDGKLADYQAKLLQAFNPATIDGLMCRNQLHVSHDGTIHDCDFNYALGLKAAADSAQHIRDFNPETHRTRSIITGPHCFGCTAGSGSSCTGALV